MAYKFNPFTGKLDETGSGGGGGTPGGSDTQVQFNDGGTFGGDAGLTYNKTTDELTLAGDLNLDDGGSFSTTVQAVTPTANRTISFPDQTGTVGLVAGATGNIQYNSSGALAATGDFNVDLNWTDAAVTYTGLKVNVTDTASAAGSKLLDLQVGGTSKITLKENELAFDTGTTVIYAGPTGAGSDVRIGGNGTIGTIPLNVGYSNITIANRATLGFTSGSNINSGVDVGIKRDSAGVVKVTDGSTGTGYIKQDPVAIANLPAAATVGAGTRGFVNDASSTTFAAVVAVGTNDGGTTKVPVYCDGTDWRIG